MMKVKVNSTLECLYACTSRLLSRTRTRYTTSASVRAKPVFLPQTSHTHTHIATHTFVITNVYRVLNTIFVLSCIHTHKHIG